MLETNTILIAFGAVAALILYLALSLNVRYCRRLALYRREVEVLEAQVQDKSGPELVESIGQYLESSQITESSSYFSKSQILYIRQQLLKVLLRYSKAAEQLDVVPVSALLDNALGRERIRVFLFSFSFPQAAFLLRSTPNLLIAVGLLGTFAGITQNLQNLGDILPQVERIADSSSVIANLRRPLAAMAIAFYSSLFGLGCSLFLTLATYLRSPIVERQRLLATLEAFIDTVYSPVFAGETRMDKAVDRLTVQFENFLNNFSTAVRDTLKEAFDERLDTFFNISSGLLSQAESLQRQASNASTTLLAAATRFEEAAITFDNSTFGELLDSATIRLEKSEVKLSASAKELAQQFDVVGGGLQRALNQIEQATGAMNATTQASAELAQSGQLLLNEVRPISQEFKKTTQSFSQTQKKFGELTKGLDTLSSRQTESLQQMKTVIEKIDQQAVSTNQALTHQGSQLTEGFSVLAQNLSQQSTETSRTLIGQSKEISQGFSHLQGHLETAANNHRSSLDRLQQEIIDRLSAIVREIESASRTLLSTNQDLQAYVSQGETVKSQWDQLLKNVQTYLDKTTETIRQLEQIKVQDSQSLSALQGEMDKLSRLFSSVEDRQDSALSQLNYQTSSILNKLGELLSSSNTGNQS
ncbi:methyl-accepting chemotaxis protein [Synechococcus elongatus]|uniref:Methyl-accepting chemotaxis protein n=1 Tax=Synechococcus elongatus PCC 11802 TaxID=2283154 RepID=A0AAT9JXZ1_SYNEL|nr:methyl-accepting chemotaxis protein [Synechococcus elongatus PCC 11802]